MSLLFPELNRKKTLENVSDFFKKDYERLLLMSGKKLTDLSSPTLSGVPGSSAGNTNETKLVDGISAIDFIAAVEDTINHCSYNSEIILHELFIKKRSWDEVQGMVYSGHYKFSYLRRQAMFEFADGFNYWQKVHHCEPKINLNSSD